METYRVYRNNKNQAQAHLSENGKRTFCGQQITGWNWGRDQDATLKDYIKYCRPRCSACMQNARVAILLEDLSE